MTKETWREWFTTDISRWITSTDKLNTFKRDPLPIMSLPEAMLLSQLT